MCKARVRIPLHVVRDTARVLNQRTFDSAPRLQEAMVSAGAKVAE